MAAKLWVITTDGKDTEFFRLTRLLDREYGELFGDEALKFLSADVNMDTFGVVVLYADGNAIACAGYKPFRADTAEIRRLYIGKEYRDSFHTTLVFNAIEELIKKAGFRYAVTAVPKVQNALSEQLIGMGFRNINNYGAYRGENGFCCYKKCLNLYGLE